MTENNFKDDEDTRPAERQPEEDCSENVIPLDDDFEQVGETLEKTKSQTKLGQLRDRGKPVPVLTVVEGPEIGRYLLLDPEAKEIIIGRAGDADLILNDESVSRFHAKLELDMSESGVVFLKLKDLNSTNGTFLNGEKISVCKVGDGDKIYFGDILTRFDLLDPFDADFQKKLAERAASARYDPLTGMLSKRFFLEEMPGLVSYYANKELHLTMLMADIDYFKKINDTFGHQSGDITLKIVTEQIRSVIREEDPLVRYGGEEIAILLKSGPEQARHIAERIRIAVTEGPYSDIDSKLKVTVSIGGALLKKSDTLETLLERADKALYQAKENGRNRVEWNVE